MSSWECGTKWTFITPSRVGWQAEYPHSESKIKNWKVRFCIRNIYQKWNISIKTESFGHKSMFCKKLKVSTETKGLAKNPKFCKTNWKLRQKSKVTSKIESFLKTRTFCQKSKVSSKIKSFVKDRKFREQLKLSSKIDSFIRKYKYLTEKSKILWIIWILLKIQLNCKKFSKLI